MLVLDGAMGEATAKLISSGAVAPQSRASAAVVELLDPRPGDRVLDLCAGPGTKTGAIAARLENRGEVVAVEKDERRCSEIEEQMSRLGASCVRTVQADAAEADLGKGYDRVLIDPPCSDLGTLASRPDARWRKSPELIERLAGIQGAILGRALDALGKGGTLVYSTCTISRREGQDRVREPLAAGHAEAFDLGQASPELADGDDSRFLQIRPDRDHTDGFFIAQLERT
jgi:16S rRNA (cytosine967-C5)-methyltransferase